tara:strand:- start:8623 stop:10278 length:1656 start_codon:yes stop_codon:yes gene_type:complete
MKLNHFSKSVVGLVRKANEDSIGSLTNMETNGNGDVFVVCDGMGGHVGGATASQLAIKSILDYFKGEVNPNPILALEKSISFANQKIFNLSVADPSLKGMGTTCTLLLRKDEKIYIAHVGDSRIYLTSNDKIYRLTKDHSFVQKLVDVGQLEDSEMESHPRKNELTRALGIASEVEVEVAENPILAKTGDKFLLCTDGLCGLVNDPTILNTINNSDGLDTVNELISLAENSGGHDNISVDLIYVLESPHSKSIFIDKGNKTLTSTQVINIPTNKKDLFKRYQNYIFITLLFLLSLTSYFIYSYINKPVIIDDSKKGDIIKLSDDNKVIHSDSLISDSVINENNSTSIKIETYKKDNVGKNQFEREAERNAEKERLAKQKRNAEKERLAKQKRNEEEQIKKSKDFIIVIEAKFPIFKRKVSENNIYFRELVKRLEGLKKITKEKKLVKINKQITRVNQTLNNLEIYIKTRDLREAKINADNLLRSLKNKVYEDQLKNEITNLKSALKKKDLESIISSTELLSVKKEEQEKKLLKQNDSIPSFQPIDETSKKQ